MRIITPDGQRQLGNMGILASHVASQGKKQLRSSLKDFSKHPVWLVAGVLLQPVTKPLGRTYVFQAVVAIIKEPDCALSGYQNKKGPGDQVVLDAIRRVARPLEGKRDASKEIVKEIAGDRMCQVYTAQLPRTMERWAVQAFQNRAGVSKQEAKAFIRGKELTEEASFTCFAAIYLDLRQPPKALEREKVKPPLDLLSVVDRTLTVFLDTLSNFVIL